MSEPGYLGKWYKWFYNNWHSREYDLLIKWFLLPFGGEAKFRQTMMEPISFCEGEQILDMTCGTGTSTYCIREKAGSKAKIVGADLSLGQVRRALRKNRYANLSFVVADAANACFPSASFVKVFLPHSLHEMPEKMRRSVFLEAKRVLRTKGECIVFELDNPASLGRRMLLGLWLGYWLPYPLNFENATRRDMQKKGVRRELKEAGFHHIRKLRRYKGTMQIVIGEK